MESDGNTQHLAASTNTTLRWLTKTFIDKAVSASEVRIYEAEVDRLRKILLGKVHSSPEYESAIQALHSAKIRLAVARISMPVE